MGDSTSSTNASSTASGRQRMERREVQIGGVASFYWLAAIGILQKTFLPTDKTSHRYRMFVESPSSKPRTAIEDGRVRKISGVRS